LQSSEDGCFLNVEIVKYDVLASGIWLVSVLTDKIENADIIIKLSEQIKSGEPPLKPDYRDKWCGQYEFVLQNTFGYIPPPVIGEITKYPFDSLKIDFWKAANGDYCMIVSVDEFGIIRHENSRYQPPYTQIGLFVNNDSIVVYHYTEYYNYPAFGKKIK
jgi:hypothetical protein